jgi:Predicted phosphohydrolases
MTHNLTKIAQQCVRRTARCCALSFIVVCGCAHDPTPGFRAYAPSNVFAYGADTREKAAPWTHLSFAKKSNEFTFAIIGDRTGGCRGNGIFESAITELNLLQPELVLSVGDLIQGYTEDRGELERQWNDFDSLAARLEMPFFYTPGNHDLSNPTMREVWKERRGAEYYAFVYKNVLFLILNTQDPNQPYSAEWPEVEKRASEIAKKDPAAAHQLLLATLHKMDWNGALPLAISERQVAYFEKIIADNPHVRWTFLFMHNPAWQGGGNPVFNRIESALGDRPYTVFGGHIHNYKYSEVNSRMHIRLGTTGGSWLPIREEGALDYFDHFMLVTLTESGPRMANILLNGVLDKHGQPLGDSRRVN